MSVDASQLARLRVEQRGVVLGTVVDVLCDPLLMRHLGFELVDEQGRHRFLPRATCQVLPTHVESVLPAGLFGGDTLAYYLERGAAFTRLVGAPVHALGIEEPGRLRDIRFDDGGARSALVVAWADGTTGELNGELAAVARASGIVLRGAPAAGLPARPPALRDGVPGLARRMREAGARA